MAKVVDKFGNPINQNSLKPVKRGPLKNKQKEVKELSAAEKAEAKARERQALKLFGEMASGSATFGQTVSGFMSLAESAKPRGKKKDPTPSKMGSSVPEISTTSLPTEKTNIDLLCGRTSKSDVVVDKIIDELEQILILRQKRGIGKTGRPVKEKQYVEERKEVILSPSNFFSEYTIILVHLKF